VAAVLIAAALFLPTVGRGAERPPIIDVHVHAYTADARFGTRWTNPLTGLEMVATPDAESHERATAAAFARYNVVRAVVSGGDHDAVLRWREHDPGRIIAGFAVDDPSSLDLTFLRKEHAAGRLQVIGEVAPQYAGILPTDPRLEPLFALAEELDVPVAYHMHPGPPGAPYMGLPKMRAGNGSPLLLEDVLVRHPKLRLYVMHAGWPMLDELVGLLYTHPQVYVDVAVIDWSQPRPEFHRYLRRLVEAGYGKRIMFGSDQMVWPDMIGVAVQAVESADFLSAEQKRDIFHDNAARFLRLKTPVP
jgi:predicted TIM-barrel fold metal-dependent hydrolase